MDDRVHPAQFVRLLGHLTNLPDVGEVTDHDPGPALEEVPDRTQPIRVAHVDDDIVPPRRRVAAAALPSPSADPVTKILTLTTLTAPTRGTRSRTWQGDPAWGSRQPSWVAAS